MSDVEAVKTQTLAAAENAKSKAMAIYEKAKAEGFFSHFGEYNTELLMPWTMITNNAELQAKTEIKDKALYLFDGLKTEIMAAITLSPATPDPSFKFYNVLGFWLGIFETVCFSLLGHGILSLAWNGALGYAIAYTLYWTMTCSGNAKYMFFSMIFIALYIGLNVYLGLGTLLYVLPSALYFGKALCDALMLVNGFVMYKSIIGPDGPLVPADAMQMF